MKKYVVFKAEDWEEFARSNYKATEFAEQKDIEESSVVIRVKDAFASAALHTYANSIAISARVLGELSPVTRDRLVGIADYFHQKAVLSDSYETKLPD